MIRTVLPPPRARALSMGALSIGALSIGALSIGALAIGALAIGALAVITPAATAAAPAAPVYIADAAQSRLLFQGTQAGAQFRGVFHKFTATIEFAPDALAASHFDVAIDVGSLDTQDKDRDGTMRGADIFDVAHWPAAHYVTRSFARTAAGYTAVGALTLRGVTKDVPVEFRFTQTPGGAKLDGTANLKRLDFGVGQGEWRSTEMVRDDVKVEFSLALKAKP